MLGLYCCSGFFSSCREWGLLSSCDIQAYCGGFSCCRAEALGCVSTVVAALGSIDSIVVQGLSCSATCGIFPDQGSNLCLLHWQADCLPLSHTREALKILSFKLSFKLKYSTMNYWSISLYSSSLP